jgi:ABC-type glycerol-3-phosphate transport system substrate-binding protein
MRTTKNVLELAMKHKPSVSRRQFLVTCAGFASGSILVACGASGAPATTESTTANAAEPTAAAAAPAASDAPIRLLIRSDIKSAYAADKAVEEWNKEMGSKITLDEPAAGDPTQKIQAAQAAGDLLWDGFAVMVVPWDTEQWVKRGLVQPLDELISTSKIPDASKVVPGIIPSILESTKYEGKQYAIPGNVGSVTLAWMTEPLTKAGIDKPPTTWDEVYAAAKQIKETSPEMTPFDSAGSPLCDLYAMMWGATDNPFNAEGLVDITGPVAIEALKWQQQMVAEELMPAIHKESFGNWLKGGTAIITSFDVAGTMAQQTFGNDKASTGTNFFKEAGNTQAGTPFWINSCVVLNKAKNPQGVADFYLWWFGPSNKATGQQIATVAAKPCYQYTYDEYVKSNPGLAWEIEGIELVRNSKQFPVTSNNGIEQAKTAPWVEKVLDPNQKMDPMEAMESALKEIKDELAKQRT